MRIFTKVRYVFFPPKGVEGQEVEAAYMGFSDVPDWVKDNKQFKRGIADGTIEIINTREQQLRAENTGTAAEKTEAQRDVKGEEKAAEKPKTQPKTAAAKTAATKK